MPFVDDRAAVTAGEERRDVLDRLLGRRQADAQKRTLCSLLQTFQRQREVRAAPRADYRMYLIEDHRPDRVKHPAAALRCQQEVQRLRRRYEDVRRRAHHRGACRRRRITCANGGREARQIEARCRPEHADTLTGLFEVLMNVCAERLQRRDIQNADLIAERRSQTFANQIVDRGQKRRERLSGAGRRRD